METVFIDISPMLIDVSIKKMYAGILNGYFKWYFDQSVGLFSIKGTSSNIKFFDFSVKVKNFKGFIDGSCNRNAAIMAIGR